MQNQKVRLTKSVVAAAEPKEREYVLWDSRVAGFGLRVRPSGARSFVFVYRTTGGRKGKTQRVTIKAANADRAFEQAKILQAQHHGGGDPAAERVEEKEAVAAARKALTVADVLDRFVDDHAKENLADRTATEYERIVDKILTPALGTTKIGDLEPKAVAEMYHGMRATPTQAALAVRVLSSAMSWAEEFGLRAPGPNPAGIRLKGPRRRTRLFTETEVARLMAAIGKLESDGNIGKTVALGLRLLFATGCRAGEICELRWSNIDLVDGQLRWPNSKTGYLEKPITNEARQLLKKATRLVGVDWVCPGSDPKKALRVETLEAGFERAMKEAKVEARENASLHLIRHWFASKTYSDKEIPLPVQRAIVGHKSVATAMRYAHVARDEVKKAAAGAAKRRAAGVRAATKRGKVVPLSGRA
ncbi:MAG: tyrosine-type recombinase/integrase [Croceibacterium sp.]